MFTVFIAAILFIGNANADETAIALTKSSEETALIYIREDVKTTDSFYHFINDSTVTIKKEAEPMIICKFENDQLNCENNIIQRIKMPMLSFWSLNTTK